MTHYISNPRCRTIAAILSIGFTNLAFATCSIAQTMPPAPTSLPNPLSLQQAIAIALAHQPTQFIADTQDTIAHQTLNQAKSEYLPTITPTYTYQNDTDRTYVTGLGWTDGNPKGSTSSVDGTETIIDTGKREVVNAQGRRQVDIARDNNANTTETTIDEVTEDYYNLLMAMDLVKVGQSQVTSGQQELDLVQAQVKVGTVAAANVYQAQATLATAQVTLSQDQGNVVTASATLKNALGVDSTAVVQPVPLAADDQLPPPPPTGGEKTLDEYLQIAYANRPDLREQEATVEYDNLNVKLAQISAGLQGAATYEFLYSPIDNYDMPFTTGTDSRLMATATYPLFDGGYSRAAVRIAQAGRDAARDTLEQERQAVHLAVEQALTDRTQAATSANLAQVGLKAAQVNYDSEVAQQKEGLATVIDVTTAQVTLVQAQDQYVSAIYQFYVADSALRRAIGQNQITASGAAAP